MKSLVIISHPELEESGSQQYLKESFPNTDNVSYHHLEGEYPDGKIDVKREQELLKNHDRIIFQFPFYWYTSPPMLKHWQDEVLEEHFAYGYGGNKLRNKELGLVLVMGIGEKEYQVGGSEGFSISELTKPYQAMAKKLQMKFLKPLSIYQFYYMKEERKMQLLVEYQQYLTMDHFDSLKSKEEWFLSQLELLEESGLSMEKDFVLDQIRDEIEDNRMELDELNMHVNNFEE